MRKPRRRTGNSPLTFPAFCTLPRAHTLAGPRTLLSRTPSPPGPSDPRLVGSRRALPPEVEVLESIYLEELQVARGLARYVPRSPSPARPRAALLTPTCSFSRWEPWEISITLHPATAQDQDSQYVRFTLVLSVPPQVGCPPTPCPGTSWPRASPPSLLCFGCFSFILVS